MQCCGSVTVRALYLQSRDRGFDFSIFGLYRSTQVVCTHMLLSPNSIILYWQNGGDTLPSLTLCPRTSSPCPRTTSPYPRTSRPKSLDHKSLSSSLKSLATSSKQLESVQIWLKSDRVLGSHCGSKTTVILCTKNYRYCNKYRCVGNYLKMYQQSGFL